MIKSTAQIKTSVGQTTTLSVGATSGDVSAWDLYVYEQDLDFAKKEGNCPETSAKFVTDNRGRIVEVQWLKPGEYFYKVTTKNHCSSNFKIGKVIVEDILIPHKPDIKVSYNCTNGTAVLTAENYIGTLLWSTGATTSSIIINTNESTFIDSSEYTLLQIVNGKESPKAKVNISTVHQPTEPKVSVSPEVIYRGETAILSADSCPNGSIHWYTDSNLTNELIDYQVSPNETTTYYAVCRSNMGCEGPYAEVTLKVNEPDSCEEKFDRLDIPNAISPNADGYNDVWEITDLIDYYLTCKVQAKVMVFNNSGVKIYEKERYMIDEERFSGYSNNSRRLGDEQLESGVYFYIIEFDNGNYKKGYLYLRGHDEFSELVY